MKFFISSNKWFLKHKIKIVGIITLILSFVLIVLLFAQLNVNAKVNNETSTSTTSGIVDIQKKYLKESFCQPTVVYTEKDLQLNDNDNYNIIIKETPSNNGFKSYMDADYIKDTSSAQYALKQYYEMSDIGVWTVEGRYCVAMGSYYTHDIGTKIDLVMYNGNVVHCILADCKADIHTDSSNRQNPNGSIVEFVVNESSLCDYVRKVRGDLSYSNDENLIGEIAYVIIYENKKEEDMK